MKSEKTNSRNDSAAISSAAASVEGLAIQRKLAIGAVNDPLEHEADAMADKVMRMPDTPIVQRKCSCSEDEKINRKPLSASITPFIQAKGGMASDTVTKQIHATKGNGSSLDQSTKSFMETRFGSDFSGVRIHNNGESIQMNRELNAKAFTVGNDIYFNEGQYDPGSNDGRNLLAHELTHTIQQNGHTRIQRSCSDGNCTTCAGGKKDLRLTAYFRTRATRRTMLRLRKEINEAKRVLEKCCINLKFSFNWPQLRGSGTFNWGGNRPAGDAAGALDYSDDAEQLGEGSTFDSARGIPMLVVDSVPGTGGGVTMINDPVVDTQYTGRTYIAVAVNQADENTSHSQIAHELWHVARNFNHDSAHGGIAAGTSDSVSDDYCTAMRGLT